MDHRERMQKFREEMQRLRDSVETDPAKEEVLEALGEYRERFHSTFPLIGFSRPMDELMICIKDCLEQGKTVYELEYLPKPTDIMDADI